MQVDRKVIVGESDIHSMVATLGPTEGDHKGQYISLKKVCESNKADSQAQIDGFYLCHIELKIPYLKCIDHKGAPNRHQPKPQSRIP